MSGYTKLFSDIVLSTIWTEPNHIKVLWITMLAIKDRYHIVNASVPGLARSSGLSVDECEEGLTLLLNKDRYSRSREFDGRRIEVVDGGWVILNGEKYRNKLSKSDRNEYHRIKQQEYRDRKKRSDIENVNKNVNTVIHAGTLIPYSDTDTDTDTKEEKTLSDFQSRFWDLYNKKIDHKKCKTKWDKLSEKTKLLIDAHLDLYVNATPTGAIPSRKNPLTYLNGECWLDEDLPINMSRPKKEKQEEINWNKTVTR